MGVPLLRVRARPERQEYLGPGRDAGPAERAVGVVLEPDVNAINVENVAAIRNFSKLLLFLEFIQTNRALAGFSVGLRFLELEDRD